MITLMAMEANIASITIRNLDEDVKKRLRKQAAEHGRSLEAEARDILSRHAIAAPSSPPKTGLDLIRPLLEFVEKHGGCKLQIPPRSPGRPLPFADEAKRIRRRK